MCHFITAVLSKSGDSTAVKNLAEAHRFRWEPIVNPIVQQQLASGETYFLTTRGICDCGTSLGWKAKTRTIRSEIAHGIDERAEKLRRQGWSQAKIDRWIESKRTHEIRRDALANQAVSARESDLHRWLSFIHQIFEAKAATGVGLLLHWYDGGIESEAIQLADRQVVTLADFTADFLQEIQEDVLYLVVRSRGHCC